MKRRQVRYRAEYVLYLMTKALLKRLSHAGVRRLGRATGSLFWALDRANRRQALSNVAWVLPELGPRRRREMVRRCFRHYGATFFELAYASSVEQQEFQRKFDVDGWEHLEAAAALGRGCFIVAGHYGTWELGLYPLGHRLGRVHLVARPPNNPLVARDAAAIRERIGHVLLPRRGAGHAMRNVLRDRGRIAIVIDQRVAPWNGILVPFMGRPAWTSPVVAYLSILTGAPVVPTVCVPEGQDRYRFSVRPAILPEGRGAAAEAALTARYLEAVEREVRIRPEFWLWMHRRWRVSQRIGDPERRARARRKARLPDGAPALHDLELPPAAVHELSELSGGAFLDRGVNVVLVGRSPEARRNAAAALGHALLERGYSVLFTSPQEMARGLEEARRRSEIDSRYRDLDAFELVILEASRATTLDSQATEELAGLLRQRAARRSVLVTTDLVPQQWDRIARDAARMETLAGALAADAVVVELDATGDSTAPSPPGVSGTHRMR